MVKSGFGVIAASLSALLVSATVVNAPVWNVQDSFARAVWTSALSEGGESVSAKAGAVSRLDGVSATVSDALAARKPDEVAARNAFFAGNQPDVTLGHEVILSTEDGRRFALRIAGRAPLTDQAVPQMGSSVNVLASSGPDILTVSWGDWLYIIKAEELRSEPVLAVQQSL